MNSKQKGNIGIGQAIAYFTLLGYTVSIPLNDSQDYDLIVDIDNTLHTVQVKYTSEKSASGHYKVGLRSISGSSKEVYKTVNSTNIDYLFIVTQAMDLYLLPICDVGSNSMTINEQFKEKYGIVAERPIAVLC